MERRDGILNGSIPADIQGFNVGMMEW